MPPVPFSRLSTARSAKWFAAAFSAVFAVALRALLQPALGDELPFVIAAPVSLFAALMWGAGPGAVATVICLAGTLLPVVPPHILSHEGAMKAVAFATCMVVACVLVARVDAMRNREDPMPTGNDTPLLRWLNAALFGAFLIPATAFIVAGWWTYERANLSSRETAVRRADLIYEHARRTFDVAQKLTIQAAALTNEEGSLIRAHESETRQRLSDMLFGLPAVVNLNVWDANAVPLVRSDRVIDPAATVADRDYFRRQAAVDRGFDVGEVLTGRQTGLELFNLTLRRPSSDGSFRGIVAISLSPEYFRAYYRAIVAQNSDVESVSLVRTDGTILARWPLLSDGSTKLPADAPSLAAIQQGQTSGVVFGQMKTTGEQRIGAFRRLEGLPVYAVVGFSRSAMMAGWVRTMGLVGAITLPITLMLIAVTTIARRRVQSEYQAQRELNEQIRLRAASEKTALEAHRRETLATLTAGVAHDFNNLLAILSNSLHVQNIRHPERVAEPQNAAMRRAIKSGTRLTRQLLSFTRRQTLKPEIIDLRIWLRELEELLRTSLGSLIKLRIIVSPDTPAVLVDAAELELALVNLAVNSKHAQPSGGSFTLTASVHAEGGLQQVLLCAIDEGEGISPEVLSRVAEPFFTTKGAGSGSGLGLHQVRGAVEAAGGQLRVESEVGRGTTVKLFLPAAHLETAAAESARSDLPCSQAGKLNGHVLVAEDNDDVMAVTAALITSLGLRVSRAANAAEALTILRTPEIGPSIGFLLTDVVMPGAMDGVELALKMRAERPDLPVTVVTGFAENVQSALDAKLDVAHKPLDPDALIARLRKAFPAAS